MAKIDAVDARVRLKARAAPYWQKLSTGCHLGFRKTAPGATGTWIAQAYETATQKQTRRSLGAFDQLPAHQRFDAAKKAAELWFMHLGLGGSADTQTVKQACEAYVTHVRGRHGIAPDDLTTKCPGADDLKARFGRWVYKNNKLSEIELPKLARKHVDAWVRELKSSPVVVNPHAKDPVTRERAPASVNRDMTALRAALNLAHDNGAVTTDMAWRVALRPIKNADGRRDAYLDRNQRVELISKAGADLAAFLKALALVPLRPGALAALTVASFDKRLGVIAIGKDKTGRDRKIKLPIPTADFFAEQATDKLPGAPLLARANGKPWDKDAWKKPVRAAAKAAQLPSNVTAYAMRHSTITDLVTGGLDILTVAQLSGTSVAMIERHYGHFRADHAAAALATLAF
jgi:integrase